MFDASPASVGDTASAFEAIRAASAILDLRDRELLHRERACHDLKLNFDTLFQASNDVLDARQRDLRLRERACDEVQKTNAVFFSSVN